MFIVARTKKVSRNKHSLLRPTFKVGTPSTGQCNSQEHSDLKGGAIDYVASVKITKSCDKECTYRVGGVRR